MSSAEPTPAELTPAEPGRPSRGQDRRGRRLAAPVLATVLVLGLLVGGWWADRQGYVSWSETACTQEGYDPVPSYEELVTEHRKSPYCARLARGETWF